MRIKNYTQKEYKREINKVKYPPYWDEGLNFKKGHSSTKYRSYKTWKYNRKTQYKPLKNKLS
jgi:hypothetical protein